MNPIPTPTCRQRLLTGACAALMLMLMHANTFAGPGAHGPGGEHLDGPAQTGSGASTPRMETRSDMFELVGHLYEKEFSLLIDRYESNEPVLDAVVEVETGSLKANARFHADQGDYAVDDPAFLALLKRPGEHALVFTIVAGKDSDLLDGSLRQGGAAGNGQGPGQTLERLAWLAAALGVGAGLLYAFMRRRQRTMGFSVTQGKKS